MKTKQTIRYCPPPFRFKCPKLWSELKATDSPDVRHCDACRHEVFFCRTDEETIAHAKAGHCIAREMPDESELPSMVLVRPSKVDLPTPEQEAAEIWYRREEGINDSIRNANAPRACPQCDYPAPTWRSHCKVCDFAMGKARKQ